MTAANDTARVPVRSEMIPDLDRAFSGVSGILSHRSVQGVADLLPRRSFSIVTEGGEPVAISPSTAEIQRLRTESHRLIRPASSHEMMILLQLARDLDGILSRIARMMDEIFPPMVRAELDTFLEIEFEMEEGGTVASRVLGLGMGDSCLDTEPRSPLEALLKLVRFFDMFDYLQKIDPCPHPDIGKTSIPSFRMHYIPADLRGNADVRLTDILNNGFHMACKSEGVAFAMFETWLRILLDIPDGVPVIPDDDLANLDFRVTRQIRKPERLLR